MVFVKTHENGCGSETDRVLAERRGHLSCLHDVSVEAVVGVQHPTLPKTAEEAGYVVHALEGNGSKDGAAISKAVPVVVPSCAGSDFQASLSPEVVVALDVVPPFPGRLWYELCDLVLVEFLDVLLGWAHHVEAELEGVGACSREMGRDADGKDFAMRKVDQFGCDGGEGDTELHAVYVVERHGAGKAIPILGIGTMDGEERVGRLRKVGREGQGVVDVGSEVCGVANGHEDVWQDKPGHLGTLCGGLGFETIFCTGEPEQPEGEGVGLVVGWPSVDAVFVEAFADEGVDKVGETCCVELAAVLAVVFEQHGAPKKGDPEQTAT
jgi:hypothetical protein